MSRPELSKIPSFYHNYVMLVKHENLHDALKEHVVELIRILMPLSTERWNYRYAEQKWSVKELVQHVIDAERIFNYRALCFARGEKNSLPGFDENLYADNSNADSRDHKDLINELTVVQNSSMHLFNSFNEKQLCAEGIANNNQISVLAIGYITVGHTKHHCNILKEKYL